MDRGQEGNFCFLPYLNNLLLSLYECFYRKSKEEKGKNNWSSSTRVWILHKI